MRVDADRCAREDKNGPSSKYGSYLMFIKRGEVSKLSKTSGHKQATTRNLIKQGTLFSYVYEIFMQPCGWIA